MDEISLEEVRIKALVDYVLARVFDLPRFELKVYYYDGFNVHVDVSDTSHDTLLPITEYISLELGWNNYEVEDNAFWLWQ